MAIWKWLSLTDEEKISKLAEFNLSELNQYWHWWSITWLKWDETVTNLNMILNSESEKTDLKAELMNTINSMQEWQVIRLCSSPWEFRFLYNIILKKSNNWLLKVIKHESFDQTDPNISSNNKIISGDLVTVSRVKTLEGKYNKYSIILMKDNSLDESTLKMNKEHMALHVNFYSIEGSMNSDIADTISASS